MRFHSKGGLCKSLSSSPYGFGHLSLFPDYGLQWNWRRNHNVCVLRSESIFKYWRASAWPVLLVWRLRDFIGRSLWTTGLRLAKCEYVERTVSFTFLNNCKIKTDGEKCGDNKNMDAIYVSVSFSVCAASNHALTCFGFGCYLIAPSFQTEESTRINDHWRQHNELKNYTEEERFRIKKLLIVARSHIVHCL